MAAAKPIIPEVVESDDMLPPDLVALRRFAWAMDEAVAIPGTRRRVGLDAAIGLIPGVGDIIGGILSAWVVIAALRHRVPFPKIGRMIVNIVADAIVGAVPLFGDVFDVLFEENVLNLALLLRHRDRSRSPRTLRQIAGSALAVVAGIAALTLAAIVAGVAALVWLAGRFR